MGTWRLRGDMGVGAFAETWAQGGCVETWAQGGCTETWVQGGCAETWVQGGCGSPGADAQADAWGRCMG